MVYKFLKFVDPKFLILHVICTSCYMYFILYKYIYVTYTSYYINIYVTYTGVLIIITFIDISAKKNFID